MRRGFKRAQTVAEKFGVEAYTNTRKLLKRKDVEAVSICTWSTNLAIEAARVLKAEKHVFVEKPMVSTLRQAKKIVDLAGTRERHLIVGFMERFSPQPRIRGTSRVSEEA